MGPGITTGTQGSPHDHGSTQERVTWLMEDEEVWGTETEAAPAVVGRAE